MVVIVQQGASAVLNEGDMAGSSTPGRAYLSKLAQMSNVLESTAPVSTALNRLWTPRLSLSGCVRGVMTRDARGVALSPEQRFNYFPASPLCSIGWWLAGRS